MNMRSCGHILQIRYPPCSYVLKIGPVTWCSSRYSAAPAGMVHAATWSCRKRPCANPAATPATARMGGTHARPPGTLTRSGKYAAISTGARKPSRGVLRKVVREAPAKAANRIQCAGLTFLHERTSTSAAAYSRISKRSEEHTSEL